MSAEHGLAELAEATTYERARAPGRCADCGAPAMWLERRVDEAKRLICGRCAMRRLID